MYDIEMCIRDSILPATILAADVCVIENLPDISDVAVSLKILSVLGAKVRMLNKNTYEIDTTHPVSYTHLPAGALVAIVHEGAARVGVALEPLHSEGAFLSHRHSAVVEQVAVLDVVDTALGVQELDVLL